MGRVTTDRTGVTRTMNNGLSATVIAYRKITDVDIQFESGAIITHRNYQQFQKGMIKCTMLFEHIDDYVRVTNPNVTPAFSFLIDAADVHLLDNCFWHIGSGGYVQGRIDGKKKLLHRHIMNAPADMLVDHKDGNRLDCRRKNLRLCSNAENLRNQGKQSTNTSGFKGVCWDKNRGKWVAFINVDGKQKNIGGFANKEVAARAYNQAAIKHHGEFARLNQI